jgi:chemotaxis protein histidine kinase CheA
LEVDPENRDILNDIFRETHSVKGASEYVGLEKIATLSHHLENLLEILRQGKISVTHSIIDLLISARDRMVRLTDELDRFNAEKTEIEDILKLIRGYSGEDQLPEEKTENSTSVNDTEPEAINFDDLEQEVEKKIEDENPNSDEIYEEDYDSELFGIYLQQLEEIISYIQTQILQLPDADNSEEILDDVVKKIESLRSSANYMGYESLVNIYKKWIDEIRDVQEGISLGESVSFHFMKDFTDKIVSRFPKLTETFSEKTKERPKVHDNISEDTQAVQETIIEADSTENNEDLDFDDVIQNELDFFDEEPEEREPAAAQEKDETDLKLDDETDLKLDDETDLKLDQEFDQEAFSTSDEERETEVSEETGTVSSEPQSESSEIKQQIEPGQDTDSTFDEGSIKAGKRGISKKDEDIEVIDLSEMELLIDDQKLYDKLDKAFDSTAEGLMDPVSVKLDEELFSPVDVTPVDPPPDKSFSEPSVQNLDKSGESVEASFFETQTDQPVSENPEILETEAEITPGSTSSEIPMEKTETEEASEPPEKIIEHRQKSVFGERLVKQTLRVDAKKIDSLMNQVGELVVSRAWFSQLFNEMRDFQQYLKESMSLDKKEMKQVRGLTFRLSEATVNLGRVANELQEGIMKVRMLPISNLFNRYPRLIRDLTRETSKKVELKIKGEDTELDKMIIEQISDPMVHILRNAVDHGIEPTDERIAKGKPETGNIILEAYHESNHVVIEIKDDGKGINPETIKETALQNGFISREEVDQMTPKEIISLIMKPGFSTAGKVTHTSGRGVGMDVVKKNVEKLNGTLEIDSRLGKETQFRIKIPLTLAIIAALMVRVGKDLFTVPLANVEETIRIFYEDITTIEGVEVIYLRNTTLPLIRLSEIFGISSMEKDHQKAFVVVVSTGMRKVGLVVDSLIGQEEVVIKPLVDYLQENSGFSGATILGDGSISLILDVYELVNLTIGNRLRQLGLGTFQGSTSQLGDSEKHSIKKKLSTSTIH